MASNGPDKSKLFINKVDENTRDHIIKLDQKLRMMRAELEAKLTSIELYDDNTDEGRKQKFLDVQHEVNAALEGISSLVNMVLEPEQEEYMLKEENMSKFKGMLTKNLENISKIDNLDL